MNIDLRNKKKPQLVNIELCRRESHEVNIEQYVYRLVLLFYNYEKKFIHRHEHGFCNHTRVLRCGYIVMKIM